MAPAGNNRTRHPGRPAGAQARTGRRAIPRPAGEAADIREPSLNTSHLDDVEGPERTVGDVLDATRAWLAKVLAAGDN
jgi:hypothetical protein